MAKEDQWFKFFYKQFMFSTQGWKDDEVGAYLRLLINQFESGRLPDDPIELSKLVTSFKKNWPLLSKKFEKCEDGFLRNKVMSEIRKERDEKSKKNSDLGKMGGRPKKNRNESESKPNAFKNESHIYSSSLSDSGFVEGGTGEEAFLIPQMLNTFKTINPKYPIELDADFAALRSIAEKIQRWENLPGKITDHNDKILKRWDQICKSTNGDNHLSKYSLTQLDKYFQSVIQSFNSNGTHQQSFKQPATKKSNGAAELVAILQNDIADLNGPGSQGN